MSVKDLLKRGLAPILPEAWAMIDDEARRVLRLGLAGRKVVDFEGPHGWKYAALSTGRLTLLEAEPVPGVSAGIRRVQPLVELRTPVRLSIMELDSVARGAEDPDLEPVRHGAEAIARAEDAAIFNGYAAAGIHGILQASPHAPVPVAGPADWPRAVVMAKEVLRAAGVGGPYALVLGTHPYEALFAAAEDGYPIVKRIERTIIDGPIVRAAAITGGVLMSVRGGDYVLTVGQDFSVGYADRDRASVELYLTESFTFRVLEPAAAVHLLPAG
ncbi:MAG: family 1 encapsulin nanocompartment shell protein [Polyangiales bacterium]